MKKMLKKWAAVMLAAVILAAGLCPADARAASSMTVKLSGTEYYSYAFQVLTLVNKERTNMGLPKLTMDKGLLSAAMDRAAETNIYFSHDRPDGSSCFTAFPQGLMGMGENIAAGQSSPAQVMNSWMNSSGHKANILNGNYNLIGIGCFKAGDCYYWVQTFGTGSSSGSAKKADYKDGKKTKAVKADASHVNISMTVSKKTLSRGGTGTIKMQLTNPSMPYDTVVLPQTQFTFKSMNASIASVTSKGVVKGLKKGKAKIKAVLKTGGLSKSVTVTVK